MSYPTPWHKKDKNEAPQALVTACRAAIKDNAPRMNMSLAFGSLYEGCHMSTFLPIGYALDNANVFPGIKEPLIRRKCRSVVKGAHATLWGNDDPLPMFISVGGEWDTQTKAKLLNRAIDAEYEQPQGRFDNTHDMWRHAGFIAMGPVGSVAVFCLPGWGKVEARINDTLTMALETSGPNGAYLGCVGTDYYEPEELCIRFPDQRADIERNATPMWSLAESRGATGHNRMQERWVVEVHFGYRCKIRKEDGRQLMALKDGTRLGKDEPYDYEELPCVIWHFERQLAGDWGLPLTAYIYEVCRRQNEVTQDVSQKQIDSPQRIVECTKAQREQMGGKVKGTTLVDREMATQAINVHDINTLDNSGVELARLLGEWADEDAMVSARHQGGQGKQGSSGVHERFNASYFTEAFAPESRRIIHARTVATGKRYARALCQMVKQGQDIVRRWEKGSLSSVIDVGDLDLDDNRYLMRVASVSEEKNSPATLLEFGQKMVEQEKASLGEYMEFRQHLDADGAGDQVTRNKQWLEKQIERWLHATDEEQLEEGFYQSPRKNTDLVAAAERIQTQLQDAETMGCPPNRLEYFELFLEELAILIDQETAQANTSISAVAPITSVFPTLGASPNGQGPGIPGQPGGGIPGAPAAIPQGGGLTGVV